MRHLTAAAIDGGFHYASLSSRGGYPLGACASHAPHPTADEARRCYRTWEREHVVLDLPQTYRNWGDCDIEGCGEPTKHGARLVDGDGFHAARLCSFHFSMPYAITALGLTDDMVGDAWVS